jgi:hypothetical protein
MGKCRKKQIRFFQILYAAKFQRRPFPEIGMQACDRFACKSSRGALMNFHPGVLQK